MEKFEMTKEKITTNAAGATRRRAQEEKVRFEMLYVCEKGKKSLEESRMAFMKKLARPFVGVLRETEDEWEWELKGNYYVTPFVNELPNEGYMKGVVYTPVDEDIAIWGLEVTRILY